MESVGTTLATSFFLGTWAACVGAFGYASYQLVVFVRHSRDPEVRLAAPRGERLRRALAERRRRIARAVVIFVIAWLVAWTMPIVAPGSLGLD